MSHRSLHLSLCLIVLLAVIAAPIAAAPEKQAPVVNTAPLWTVWNPTHYALAEDATSLWIGAVGGVIRWDKSGGTYRRYTAIDGLPHHHVYAVAVDSAGNRWFGGDGGLSRLDANEVWSHITPANSTLTHRLIDGIAVGADGALWVSHGATGGVSRRQVDGRWQWFPHRAAAVAADYALILRTQNANRLWTVQGATVWVDYALYDGATWTDRTPPDSTAAVVDLVVDRAGAVWALDKASIIRSWGGLTWTRFAYRYEHLTQRLAVDPQGTVWVTWRHDPFYSLPTGRAGYGQLLDAGTYQEVAAMVSPTALLPTAAGAWVTGWGWLVQPDRSLYSFTDTPIYPDLTDAFMDRAGQLWLFSHYRYTSIYAHEGRLQTLNDRGTPALTDDQWIRRHRIMYLDCLRQGWGADLWLAWSYQTRFSPFTRVIERWHQGAWHRYDLPSSYQNLPIQDIFAQDERHTWFVYAEAESAPARRQGVLALDDQGTPTDTNDDQWVDYPIRTTGRGGRVMIDTGGRLWYGDSSALYFYDNKQWVAFTEWYTDDLDLLLTLDGTLLVVTDNDVRVIAANHATQSYPIATFIHEQFPLLRAAQSSSAHWTLAPDGAVWFTIKADGNPRQLRRYDGITVQTFTLPAQLAQLTTPLVDANNHVWAVGDATLWRLSPAPDFQLQANPNPLLLARGQSQQAQITVMGQGGYSAPVSVQLGALPETLTATVTPTIAQPGEQMTVTLTSNPATATGDYSLTLTGSSGVLTHTVALTVTVVEKLYENYLPIVNR